MGDNENGGLSEYERIRRARMKPEPPPTEPEPSTPEPPPPDPPPPSADLAPRQTPVAPTEPPATTNEERHSSDPEPAAEREIPPARTSGRHLEASDGSTSTEEKAPRTRWERWRPFIWALAVTFIALNIGRCGFVQDAFAEPTGEQWLIILETELKAAGLTDASWNCIEGDMRDGGYVDELNKEDMAKIDESLNSPQRLPTPELGRFLDGFRLFYNPGEATSCVTQAEFNANSLPTVSALYLRRSTG